MIAHRNLKRLELAAKAMISESLADLNPDFQMAVEHSATGLALSVRASV